MRLEKKITRHPKHAIDINITGINNTANDLV